VETTERFAVGLGLLAVVGLALGFGLRVHRRHAPTTLAVGPAPAGAGAFSSCGRTLVQSDDALRAIAVDGCPKLADEDLAFLGCSPSGTWAMNVERAVRRPVKDDPCGDVGLVVSLTHFAKDGSATVASPGALLSQPWKIGAEEVQVNASVLQGPGSRHLEEPQFFDFDGDGDEEVIVFGSADEEGWDPTLQEVWTFKRGAVLAYTPALGIPFEATTDLDGDKRPDLIGRGPWSRILAESETGASYPIAPSFFVALSLPDGTFDPHAPAAIEYARSKCGARPQIDWSTTFFDDALAQNIVCARLYGTPAAALHESASVRCAKADRCPLWVTASMDVEPPFVFP
jgi:hypothetical protein